MPVIVEMVRRAENFYNMDLVWRLMTSDVFCDNENILKNNLDEDISNHQTQVFNVWINYCKTLANEKKEDEARELMENFFKYLEKNEVFITEKTANGILTFFDDPKKASIASLYNQGNLRHCSRCRGVLGKFKLNEDDISLLSSEIKSLKPINNDKILNNFELFIQSQKTPFDLVVDGQNVFNRTRPGGRVARYIKSRDLYHVVQHFSNHGWRVLVIHKPWFESMYHGQQLRKLKSVSVYILEENSDDDLYILLAALLSGANCKILSEDYFRQYHDLFDHNNRSLSNIFIKWQLSSQIRIRGFRGYTDKIDGDEAEYCDPEFTWPFQHPPAAHVSPHTHHWHLPIVPQDHQHGIYVPTRWICVKPRSNQDKSDAREIFDEFKIDKRKKIKLSKYKLFR